MIQTKNLQLLPVEHAHRQAFARGKSELAALLRLAVPERWPQFRQAFALSTKEGSQPALGAGEWGGYFFVHARAGALVGNGGFKGPPDASGAVEIGYEIAEEYWKRGFATEAVRGMIAFAFSHRQVNAVTAHTLAQRNASNSVLLKAGMRFVGEVDDWKLGKTWRWQLLRPA